mmetsp:Transcript_21718/g.39251  ORF Transcript_21718/g.39251 Transcript_21718/m.39251 type:complete len:267 (-) Transcript_21718:30-830(-)
MPPRTNAKAAAGRARKDDNKAAQNAKEAKVQQESEDREWQQGSNTRGQGRAESAAQKADEVARKRREKEALMKAEEEGLEGVVSSVKINKKTAGSKKKGKKKNDLSLLEDALVSGAEKKTKAAKAALVEKQARLLAMEQERAQKKKEQLQTMDPLLRNTNEMLGQNFVGPNEGGEEEDAVMMVGRAANRASMQDGASGMDAALSSLTVSQTDEHPEKRVKALHKAFEEKMMPICKQDYPGLRMSQYKDKIFQLWKKSPENPLNQQP